MTALISILCSDKLIFLLLSDYLSNSVVNYLGFFILYLIGITK